MQLHQSTLIQANCSQAIPASALISGNLAQVKSRVPAPSDPNHDNQTTRSAPSLPKCDYWSTQRGPYLVQKREKKTAKRIISGSKPCLKPIFVTSSFTQSHFLGQYQFLFYLWLFYLAAGRCKRSFTCFSLFEYVFKRKENFPLMSTQKSGNCL